LSEGTLRKLNQLQPMANQEKTHQKAFNGPLNSIVILARERYGDAIMQTPLIAALKDRYPSASIYMIAFTQIIYDFFKADSNISAVYHAKREFGKYLLEFLPRKYDLFFNPKAHPSTNFGIQSRIIRARYKVGHRNSGNEKFYDYLLDLPADMHESDRNLSLLKALDPGPLPKVRPYIPQMPVSKDVSTLIDTLPQKTHIGINLSTGSPGGNRSFEQWSDLINSFPNERFIIFSSPADIGKKKELEAALPNVLPTPSTKNLYEVLQILEKLKLLVTPDTSLIHLAACSDTPLVALYRYQPLESKVFSPMTTLHEVIGSNTLDVMDIEDEKVTEAVKRMLERLAD